MLKLSNPSCRRRVSKCFEIWRSGGLQYSQLVLRSKYVPAPLTVNTSTSKFIRTAGEQQTWYLSSQKYFHVSVPLKAEKIVVVPAFADSISEGDVKWEKAVGDTVSADETVAEIETDKTSILVPAPGSGVIEELFVEDGATVKPGMKLFKMRITG